MASHAAVSTIDSTCLRACMREAVKGYARATGAHPLIGVRPLICHAVRVLSRGQCGPCEHSVVTDSAVSPGTSDQSCPHLFVSPLIRFTAHKTTDVTEWSVFDHLHRHSISGSLSQELAAFIAHAQEHAWRQRCDRWQQGEHWDSRL